MLEAIGKFVTENWRTPVEVIILATVLSYIYLYLRGTHGARFELRTPDGVARLSAFARLVGTASAEGAVPPRTELSQTVPPQTVPYRRSPASPRPGTM